MDADDRAYEFLLSDHPAAKAERLARRACGAAVTDRPARVRTFGDGMPANLHNLAETLVSLDQRASTLDAADAGEPDEVWVARARQRFTHTARTWGDDPDYRYPVRYVGPAAAHQPNLLTPTPTAPPAPRPGGPGLDL